ncbi:MAG: helix-turn-helix transcriptional regulator [Bacteroidaceae bacterium]|nr:helix-turn-helix transcriptional regulator [Bacteroidaceae bacterium]
MIYQNIKAIAAEQKVSISEIEEKCGITPRYMCTWDNITPGVDKVVAVARFLGVSVEELIKD